MKDLSKFNKFCEKYDLYGDGVEEEVVELLKSKFPKYFKAAKDDLMKDNGGDESEDPSPGSVFAYLPTNEDKKFFDAVEKLFKEKFSDDLL